MYAGYATQLTIIIPARVYFFTAEICFVAGPTTTEALRFDTIPVLETVVKRDAIGRNMTNLD